ncbi:hypothetical protein SAMN04488587_0328 [Methanococcoides vulcani]|uniref:Flagellin N-terminal-like domain-containing protein n=1 Tax=Methanococcoides vulcani TaxID=1353158 RepID=A0A1H9Y7T8_9EURY|nr:hypothetical protein [Methanococcoides vulcani]SES64994.1 hypothetical protein SAMN04488587_0328 [Methanococcoides vulcani]
MHNGLSIDDRAVSTVIGAILVLAVLTTFLTALQAYYIPSLAADHEVQHMQDVKRSFSEISSIAVSESSVDMISLPLGDGGLPLLSSLSSSGTLTMDPDAGWTEVMLTNVSRKKEKIYLDGNPKTIVNVLSVSDLVLESDNTGQYSVTISPDNSTNDTIEVQVGSVDTVNVTLHKNSTFPTSKLISAATSPPGSNVVLDLLNPAFGFKYMLEDAENTGPFTLTFDGPASGMFHVFYEKPAYTLQDRGSSVGNVSLNFSAGYFRYRASNNFWIDQELIFENGALIIGQGGCSAVRSNPFIKLDEDGSVLTLWFFDLVGEKESVSGNGMATVTMESKNHRELIYPYVENTSITMHSYAPDAFETYMYDLSGGNIYRNNDTITAWFENKTVRIIQSDMSISFV